MGRKRTLANVQVPELVAASFSQREGRWGLSDQCFPSNCKDENPRSQGGRAANGWWDSWLVMVLKESKEFTLDLDQNKIQMA